MLCIGNSSLISNFSMKFRGKQKQLDREVARCFRLTRQPNSDGGTENAGH